jgi:tetratricopeptide (TPR) repeat protein
LFCFASLTATAVADPAIGAMQSRNAPKQESKTSFWPWSKKEAAPQSPLGPVVQPAPERPTDKISPAKHPIKYFKTAMSELPIGKGKNASAPRTVMSPATTKVDSLSLSVPAGPPSPELFIYAAQMCEKEHDVQQARANFQRALAMWPGQVEVLRAAARMEDRLGNMPLAENLYTQAATANPQHAGALNDLGLCLARQGKLEPSLQMLEQAVQLQPSKALYRNNAATVLVEMRQDQRALAHLAAVHGPAEANFNLGQLLVERNRAADAAPYFQAALEQNPEMLPAQEALAKLQSTHMAAAPRAAAPRTATAPAAVAPAAAPQPTIAQGQQYTYPTTGQPQTAATAPTTQAPRYLPPVAARPGAIRR